MQPFFSWLLIRKTYLYLSTILKIFIPMCLFAYPVHAKNMTDYQNVELAPLKQFFIEAQLPRNAWPNFTFIKKTELPERLKVLLTQPLLTPAIAQYYQRTPKILPPLQLKEDKENQRYYRAILMIVDQNAQRDDALQAHKNEEDKVVELGLITINFSALPQAMIEDVRKGAIPFGTLLRQHQIKTDSIDQRYFKINCDPILNTYLSCSNQTLYGRTNTLIRHDHHVWVARVVEILMDQRVVG